MTTAEHALTRATDYLSAEPAGDYTLIYWAQETRRHYCVEADALVDLGERLLAGEPEAYSRWCADQTPGKDYQVVSTARQLITDGEGQEILVESQGQALFLAEGALLLVDDAGELDRWVASDDGGASETDYAEGWATWCRESTRSIADMTAEELATLPAAIIEAIEEMSRDR